MRIAVVASSPTPFAPGGAERLWNGLVREINEGTPHTGDLIKLPARQTPLPALVESYRAFAELDLSGFDRVITTKYPAWLVGHPSHVVYMIHKLRPVYDRYPATGLPESAEAEDPDARALQTLMRAGHDRGALPDFFERFDRLARARGWADPLFRVPGPFAREVTRYLDGVGLDPRYVRAYFAISKTVAARPDYFPDGIDVGVAYPPSDLDGFACRSFDHFLAASRLVPHKRVGLVAEAMRFVEGDARLKVAGDGPERDRLRALARGDARIELLGRVSSGRLIDLYADARAVVFAPAEEDLGYIAIEAMRSAKPVVTCRDSGGPTELVEDGVNGFVTEPTPEAVGAAMDRLARDGDLARRLGAAAAERVGRVSWGETVRALLGEAGGGAAAPAGPLPRAAARPTSAGDDAQALERERALLRRQRAWAMERIGELGREIAAGTAQARRLREELREQKARLQAVYDTKTWKVRKRVLPIVRAVAGRGRSSPAEVRSDPPAEAPPAPEPPPVPALPAGAVVAFFPDIRDRNPYQAMLYGSLGEAGLSVLPCEDPAALTEAPASGPLVFHVHWTAPVLRGARTELDAMRRYARFVGALDALAARGAKIAWTIHNVLPHECRFPHLEAELCQEIAVRADLIHVMCGSTVEAVAPYYVLPPGRVRVVPHASYAGIYPNTVLQEDARRRLGLGAGATVLCFLGGIRAYKGVGRLLDAFESIAAAASGTRLIVAGPAGTFEGLDDLAARCEEHPGVVARLGRVPDDQIQVYMNASDVVVLPHRSGLNSGALMLALTFGRPVVAPRVGCIGELVTPDVGMTFDPDAPGDLEAALGTAGVLKDPRYREAALAKARGYPPGAMAADFATLVAELIGDRAR